MMIVTSGWAGLQRAGERIERLLERFGLGREGRVALEPGAHLVRDVLDAFLV